MLSVGEEEEGIDKLVSSSITSKRDRFIASRETTNIQVSNFNLYNENDPSSHSEAVSIRLSKCLYGEKVSGAIENEKILSITKKPPPPTPMYHNTLRMLYSSRNIDPATTNALERRMSRMKSKEIRMLDAPGLVDDYYTQVIDSNKENFFAVALGRAVYYWHLHDEERVHETARKLFELEEEDARITSLSWSPRTKEHLVIAVTKNRETTLQIWDIERNMQIRALQGHTNRINCTHWSNSAILSSGSEDETIRNWDARIQNACVSTLYGNTGGATTGLRWNEEVTQLASGYNSNVVNVWSSSNTQTPQFSKKEHTAAVKAIAWCPWQANLLATGAGSLDRSIKTWNSVTGTLLDSIDTGSQVTALLWSSPTKELISSHGYSTFGVTVWAYPKLVPVMEWKSHSARVLGLALSSDYSTIVSASADETIRFWALKEEDIEISNDEEERRRIHSSIR